MLALEALLLELATALQLGVMALVVGRFLGLAGVADVVADVVDQGAYLRVGVRLHLRLQLVGPVDQGLDAPELAVVRVDETAQEAKHWSSRSLVARAAGLRPGRRPGPVRPSASADGSHAVTPTAGRKV